MARLNPSQQRLLDRHLERAAETLREADRLLKGACRDVLDEAIAYVLGAGKRIDKEETREAVFAIADLPEHLVPYVESPFAQALAFNLFCQREGLSHTRAAVAWKGGPAAVAARNLVFLPAIYDRLWEDGAIDKTRLLAIANRNLTDDAYRDIADMVRTRRKEDVDERLLKMPSQGVRSGRRGPEEAVEAAHRHGWTDRFATVTIPQELVAEAESRRPAPLAAEEPGATGDAGTNEVGSTMVTGVGPQAERSLPETGDETAPGELSAGASAGAARAGTNGHASRLGALRAPAAQTLAPSPADQAQQTLRAGLGGARLDASVVETLQRSPDPLALVEKFLAAHRHAGDADPEVVTRTLFFAHAGPMQQLTADDKLLLRHFRPVKTQKRGQLFYRLLEVIEGRMLERSHLSDLDARGVTEADAVEAVRAAVTELNKDPNRHLVIPAEWLGEVTRRHLYFGSRTRKEGAAYKWFRRIGERYYLGGHKTRDEVDERTARRAAKAALRADGSTDEEE